VLTENKETVIVVAMFSARPKTGVRTQFLEDKVADNLGSKEIEISPGATARFGAIAVPHAPRHRLDESAPNLLINVVSGRRSNKNNLLECDIYQDTLISATGKNISLNCKLIRE